MSLLGVWSMPTPRPRSRFTLVIVLLSAACAQPGDEHLQKDMDFVIVFSG